MNCDLVRIWLKRPTIPGTAVFSSAVLPWEENISAGVTSGIQTHESLLCKLRNSSHIVDIAPNSCLKDHHFDASQSNSSDLDVLKHKTRLPGVEEPSDYISMCRWVRVWHRDTWTKHAVLVAFPTLLRGDIWPPLGPFKQIRLHYTLSPQPTSRYRHTIPTTFLVFCHLPTPNQHLQYRYRPHIPQTAVVHDPVNGLPLVPPGSTFDRDWSLRTENDLTRVGVFETLSPSSPIITSLKLQPIPVNGTTGYWDQQPLIRTGY